MTIQSDTLLDSYEIVDSIGAGGTGEVEAQARQSSFWIRAAVLILVAAMSLAGCGSDSPTSPASGMLAVELTDAPTDELSQLNVYITGLTVKPADGPVERIADDIGLVDLLTLQNTTELIALTTLAPGEYTFIQLDLDQDQSSVVELATGEQKPLQIASEEIKVVGGFQVIEAATTRVTLDFDAERSLRKLGNGLWLLVPIVIQTKAVQET